MLKKLMMQDLRSIWLCSKPCFEKPPEFVSLFVKLLRQLQLNLAFLNIHIYIYIYACVCV